MSAFLVLGDNAFTTTVTQVFILSSSRYDRSALDASSIVVDNVFFPLIDIYADATAPALYEVAK